MRSYRNVKSLQKHKQQHLGRTQCPVCLVLLSSVSALRRHVATRHGQTPAEVNHLVPIKRRSRLAEDGQNNHLKQHEGLTKCPICGRVSSIVPSLRIHLRVVHKMSAEEVYRLVPLPSTFRPPAARRYPAHGTDTEPTAELPGHTCDVCGKWYKYRTSLTNHKRQHEGLTLCVVCGLAASNINNLRLHLPSPRFCCQFCGKSFSSVRSRTNHLKLHQGRTGCPACGGTYSSLPYLRRHLETVHGMSADMVQAIAPLTGTAQYQCSTCSRWYTNQRSLVFHMRKHQGLCTCPVCGRVCSMVHSLRRHMYTVHKMSTGQVSAVLRQRGLRVHGSFEGIP
ncbi:zinc finger protein 879-like [Pollicipes pollicipes]|uniref:zinc finger protein 879-like n=1 Tax=Pollicipes pollicipes TaxID=41117 RepID=UPI001884A1C4|nr:zinc finger protein 879-like [Pollicipes pollicipes]